MANCEIIMVAGGDVTATISPEENLSGLTPRTSTQALINDPAIQNRYDALRNNINNRSIDLSVVLNNENTMLRGNSPIGFKRLNKHLPKDISEMLDIIGATEEGSKVIISYAPKFTMNGQSPDGAYLHSKGLIVIKNSGDLASVNNSLRHELVHYLYDNVLLIGLNNKNKDNLTENEQLSVNIYNDLIAIHQDLKKKLPEISKLASQSGFEYMSRLSNTLKNYKNLNDINDLKEIAAYMLEDLRIVNWIRENLDSNLADAFDTFAGASGIKSGIVKYQAHASIENSIKNLKKYNNSFNLEVYNGPINNFNYIDWGSSFDGEIDGNPAKFQYEGKGVVKDINTNKYYTITPRAVDLSKSMPIESAAKLLSDMNNSLEENPTAGISFDDYVNDAEYSNLYNAYLQVGQEPITVKLEQGEAIMRRDNNSGEAVIDFKNHPILGEFKNISTESFKYHALSSGETLTAHFNSAENNSIEVSGADADPETFTTNTGLSFRLLNSDVKIDESDKLHTKIYNNKSSEWRGKEFLEYFEARKDNQFQYWSRLKPINNDFQMRQVKSGDLILCNPIAYMTSEKAKAMGFENAGGVILQQFIDETKKLDDSNKYKKARLKWAEEQEKYKSYDTNYISGGSFFDESDGKWYAYVAYPFGKDANRKIGTLRVNLDSQYIKGFKSLGSEYKIVYDKNGEIVNKDTYSRVELDGMSENEIELVNNVVNNLNTEGVKLYDNQTTIKMDDDDVDIQLSEDENVYSVRISGFAGDEAVMDMADQASVGDVIVFNKWVGKKKLEQVYAVKIQNAEGGIVAKTINNEIILVNPEMITRVYLHANNDSKLLDELNQTEAAFASGYDNIQSGDNLYSIFPFFNHDQAVDEDGNPVFETKKGEQVPVLAKNRKEMAKNLKKGDIIKVQYVSDGKIRDSLFEFQFATSTRAYYKTRDVYDDNGKLVNKGFLNYVSIDQISDAKWQKNDNGEWYNTGDPSTYKPEIIAAYSLGSKADGALYDYVQGRKDFQSELFNQKKKIKKAEPTDNIEDAIMAITGQEAEISMSINDDNGEVEVFQHENGLDQEWNMQDLSGLKYMAKLDSLSDLSRGDLVEVNYSKDGETRKYLAVFKGYSKDGDIKVIYRRKEGNKTAFDDIVKPADISRVGRRLKPLVYYQRENENGERVTYYSSLTEQDVKKRYDDILTIHTLADGHTSDLKYLQDRLRWFYENGKRAKKFTAKEKQAFEKKHPNLKEYFGNTAKSFEFAKFFVYKDLDGVKHYKMEETDMDGWSLTNEEAYYIKADRHYDKTNAVSEMEMQTDSRGRRIREQWGLEDKSFEDIHKLADIGDSVELFYPDENGKNKYISGIISKKTGSMMAVSYVLKSADGTCYPCSVNLYGSRYDDGNMKVKRLYTKIDKKKMELINSGKIKESKDTRKIVKSHDSKEAVSLITRNLQKIYNADVDVMSNEEMISLGDNHGINLSGTRACVIDGKIYINIDKASTADVLHEFTHILLPGLKARNPEAYQAILSKVQEHPAYKQVQEEYGNLSDQDLAEEAFCTIFGEYFRKQLMDKAEQEWYDGDFLDIASSVADVVKDVAQVDFDLVSAYDLMNMSLDEIMDQFGSDLITGQFDRVYQLGHQIESNNNDVSRVYQSLIDSGDLLIIC